MNPFKPGDTVRYNSKGNFLPGEIRVVKKLGTIIGDCIDSAVTFTNDLCEETRLLELVSREDMKNEQYYVGFLDSHGFDTYDGFAFSSLEDAEDNALKRAKNNKFEEKFVVVKLVSKIVYTHVHMQRVEQRE